MAKRDLAESGKKVGVGVGMFGLAGTLALYGLAALIATAILGIAEGVAPWIAAGIVTLVLFIAAGIAAVVGKGRISHVTDAPHERSDSVKADVAAARHGTGWTDGDAHDERP
ncbi:phage holin family protein [Aeromicrobium sp. UC242_57]|uniref:phage holin family protein n=1 Tax=Aeromicrobium sp. UC242_57 TaxID=3374624 RepID=UPI00378D84EA